MENPNAILNIGFKCPNDDCGATVKIDLPALLGGNLKCTCDACKKEFTLDADVPEKLLKIKTLSEALDGVQGLLRDCAVGVATPLGEVKVPYGLVLTQLKNIIELNVDGKKAPFSFWTTQEKKK